MSQLVGSADGMAGFIRKSDDRIIAHAYDQEVELELGPLLISDFRSPWWPRSGMIGDYQDDVGALDCGVFWYDTPEYTSGSSSLMGIFGVTRDQYGSAIGSCVVKLFRTSDDSLQSQVTSDPNTGAFMLTTPYYPDRHYIVSYKAGAPDISGASVNTLIGS